jgi:hypothetical protein
MINLTEDDIHTISNYIRLTHEGYNGPVFVNIRRLEQLHMASSKLITHTALAWARHKSKG